MPACVILCLAALSEILLTKNQKCAHARAIGDDSLHKGQTGQRSPLTHGLWNLVSTK